MVNKEQLIAVYMAAIDIREKLIIYLAQDPSTIKIDIQVQYYAEHLDALNQWLDKNYIGHDLWEWRWTSDISKLDKKLIPLQQKLQERYSEYKVIREATVNYPLIKEIEEKIRRLSNFNTAEELCLYFDAEFQDVNRLLTFLLLENSHEKLLDSESISQLKDNVKLLANIIRKIGLQTRALDLLNDNQLTLIEKIEISRGYECAPINPDELNQYVTTKLSRELNILLQQQYAQYQQILGVIIPQEQQNRKIKLDLAFTPALKQLLITINTENNKLRKIAPNLGIEDVDGFLMQLANNPHPTVTVDARNFNELSSNKQLHYKIIAAMSIYQKLITTAQRFSTDLILNEAEFTEQIRATLQEPIITPDPRSNNEPFRIEIADFETHRHKNGFYCCMQQILHAILPNAVSQKLAGFFQPVTSRRLNQILLATQQMELNH